MKKYFFIYLSLLVCLMFSNMILSSPFSLPSASATGEDLCNFTNLIVFAKFNDEQEFVDDVYNDISVKQLIENSYSKAEYSVKDYYYRVSNGNVNLQNLYLFDNGGSFTLSHNRGYYYEKSDDNQEGYDSSEYSLRLNDLQIDWTNAIQSTMDGGGKITNFDGSKKYSIEDLDKNGDGKIDNITIIYKYSTDYDVKWKGCLWNYQSYTNRIELVSNGKTITSYSYVQISYDCSFSYVGENGSLRFASLKTMIHEMGHVFGLKDLYNQKNNTPVYYMSAMAMAISPVPQYISAKEREVLGWIDDNVQEITSAGEYTIKVTSSEMTEGIICYKLKVPSLNRILYLEYRKFDGDVNKYDSLSKILYDKDSTQMKNININSGLVCFLLDADTLYPNNMYRSTGNWNYEVLGGQYSTKTDSALATGGSLQISNDLSVNVLNMDNNSLSFKVVGSDIEQAHEHLLEKVEYQSATCVENGVIEHYKCKTCGKLFLEDGTEITYKDTIIASEGHKEVEIKGKNATCEETGLTDGVKCEVCGEILVEQEEIKKLDHVESIWIIDKEPTTTKEGLKHKKCINCEEILLWKNIPKLEEPKYDNPDLPAEREKTINIPLVVTIVAISLTLAITLIVIQIKMKRKKFKDSDYDY